MFKEKKSFAAIILLAYVSFIALGMPDGLLGVGWPSMRAGFSQPLDALGLLLITSVAGYMTSSFFSGKLIGRLGVGGVLAASCTMTGLTLISYTLVSHWWVMVLLGILCGFGAGAIDAGLNTYIASRFSERVMQWLHASYGIGVTLGPLIMTGALKQFASWRPGYRVVGGIQLVLAVIFLLSLPLWRDRKNPGQAEEKRDNSDERTPYGETFGQPAVWVSIVLFFLYTGSEVTLGTWAYSLLTEGRGITAEVAGLVSGSYWLMFTIGRILAGLLTRKAGIHRLVMASLLGALLGAVLVWWNVLPAFSVIGVGMIGFCIAPIFPALMSGTVKRVGSRYTSNTIGMQMSAAGLGASLIPGLVGVLARSTSLEAVPVCLLVLFILILGLYQVSLKIKCQV